MSLILRIDPARCPNCHKHSIRWDARKCKDCDAKLFHPSDNFVALKQDWVLSYYVYFPANSSGYFRGWVHSTQLNEPKPIAPNWKPEAPDKNYGKKDRIKDSAAKAKPADLGAEIFH
jgi:hypothetical protein